MILESLMTVISSLISMCFSLLPNIPKMPATVTNTLTHVTTIITDNLGLLECVIRPQTLLVIIPLLVVTINIEHIWNVIWWIIEKIPILNIS